MKYEPGQIYQIPITLPGEVILDIQNFYKDQVGGIEKVSLDAVVVGSVFFGMYGKIGSQQKFEVLTNLISQHKKNKGEMN